MQAKQTSGSGMDRRQALGAMAVGISGLAAGRAAAALISTPAQSRGPFYPQELPLDSDSDLVQVQGRSALAKGEITDLSGRVLDDRGRAVSGAQVEIWQCDAFGRYHHPWDRRNVPLDPNFQGYGRYTSAEDGGYRFRTIKPVAYPGRAPHIHFAVTAPDAEPFITQMYVAGAAENERDFLLNRIGDPRQRASLLVDFSPADGGGLVARFDIVLKTG